jgi:hypothetical protein
VQHLEGVARAVAERQDDVARQRSSSPLASRLRRDTCRASMCTAVTRLWKRISPPSDSISRRMCSTMLTSRKVPMCGLRDVEDLLRRAGLDELGRAPCGRDARVLDLAVELAVGEGAGAAFAELHVRFRVEHLLRHSPQVSFVRSRTALPRSRTIGLKPICARTSAAKMPAGPKPTITGRLRQPFAGAVPTKW